MYKILKYLAVKTYVAKDPNPYLHGVIRWIESKSALSRYKISKTDSAESYEAEIGTIE